MASAKPPEKVIPVTHAKPWLEEKLRHVELKLAAIEDFEKVSTEEGFQERMLFWPNIVMNTRNNLRL